MEIKEIVYNSPEYQKSLDLRFRVLRKPLGLTFNEEFLLQDKDQYHLAMFDNDRVIGILILKPLNNDMAKMRQVAIDFDFQNKGLGKKLVDFCEKFLKNKNFKKIELNARKEAVPFYLSLHYIIEGDEFLEVGIPHFKMYKHI